MNKLIIIALALIFSFSCNRKSTDGWVPLTKKELKQHKGILDSLLLYNSLVDSLNNHQISVDTGDGNLIKYTDGTALRFTTWEPTIDTSDVIIKYVFNWEEGEIETLTAKVVYTTSTFGIWLGVVGESSKLYKVKDGIWVPIEWPKDPVELYIRPKK